MSEETGRKISHVALKKHLEKDLWEIFPEDYETNEDGSFVLTDSGKPKKKTGRPKGVTSQYNYSAEAKRKIKLRQKKAKIQKEKKKLAKQEERDLRRKKKLSQRLRRTRHLNWSQKTSLKKPQTQSETQ